MIDKSTVDLSIIIPVWKEERGIEAFLLQLQNDLSVYSDFSTEIILVDGHPTQSTFQSITQSSKLNPNDFRMFPSLPGRGTQMNCGAKEAKGKFFFFLHADSWLEKAAWNQIFEHIKDNNGAMVFSLQIDSPKLLLKWISATANLRSKLSKRPYGDQGLIIDKDSFFAIGGFPDIPLLEDIEIAKRIRKNKISLIMSPQLIYCSARRWEKLGVIKTTIINQIVLFRYAMGTSPEKLSRFYRRLNKTKISA